MIGIILAIIVGLAAGGLIVYLCLAKRLKAVRQLDEETAAENARLEMLNLDWKYKNDQLNSINQHLSFEIDNLNTQKDLIKGSLADLEEQARKSAEVFERQALEIAQQNIEQSMELMGRKYQQAEDAYKEEYVRMVEDCVRQFLNQQDEMQGETEQLSALLSELRAKSDSAVAAAKRAEEMRTATDFYKLQLTEVDLQEIEMLRNVAPYLRDKEPLNKVIWKCYYEKPTTDLIGRVIGSGVHTGIYKITNLKNQMCYVGQAANLAERWKQHIKRGVGADAPTRNKLYPAMIALGPESFSFEVIEECNRDFLDEREDYWQDYFKAKEFGYSIK